ncbi:GNAT family N-acetyltransferase [Vibrio sp. JC009]|uniref:GNAT family N-acetyltransferase n=1 Tax=Vibrio sp. JC009 TaxID=2912314 RepID=UPI0023B1F1EF|nr:GNAT family N-acetyltransferase [Vibrio sp. JC009]WED24321.1 GNAT family N-acetyltransferase [Vibrio sp. JC009]
MNFDWVEWFGYLASLVVLISLTMTSIIKLRVINFIGCLLFATFAYFIDSYPTMFMNLGIAGINTYYLWKIYSTKERFKLISATVESEYFDYFVTENQSEIELQSSVSSLREADTAFYMLRNNTIAGVLAGSRKEDGVMDVVLDYVTPEYRDFKLAQYFYESHPEIMKEKGINKLVAHATNEDHEIYLKKVGFEPGKEQGHYYKQF